MTRQIEFTGKSGAVYRYTALDEERTIPPLGANYVIAKVTPEGASIVYADETDNLHASGWRDRLTAAKEQYGATEVLMRLNVRSAVRQAEKEDIVEEHHPPMNEGARA